MAINRVRHPGTKPADKDLGPECRGWPKAWMTMRRTIDDAIVKAADQRDVPAALR